MAYWDMFDTDPPIYPAYALKFQVNIGDTDESTRILYVVPVGANTENEMDWTIRDLIAGLEAQGYKFVWNNSEVCNKITYDSEEDEEIRTAMADWLRDLTGSDPRR